MQKQAEEFTKRGVRILAVSVDPPDVTSEHVKKMGFSFPVFLSDESMQVIRRFDIVHEGGNYVPRGEDVARPAEFLIGPDGVIRWRFLAEAYQREYRMTGEIALEAIDAAQAAD